METENIENLRRKLRFRSWHRGTREMDLIMGRFADQALPDYSLEDMQAYEALLSLSDPDLYNWLTEREAVPANLNHSVFQALKASILS